jgi:hydrogenase maturation protease
MKTLIVGLGNPILGDDGVGWKVAEAVKAQLTPADHVEVICLSVGGLGLMEQLIGYDRVILVDAFISDREPAGSILVRRLDDLPNYSAYHITSAHDTSLQSALQLGRTMGAHLPDEVCVVGIAIHRIREFGELLSPPVAEAVDGAAHIVLNFLKQGLPVSLKANHWV